MTNQEQIVKISSQEAYELFKFWTKNSAQAYQEDEFSLAKEWDERADKWLEVALKLSKSK
jgi:hypothetical protein